MNYSRITALSYYANCTTVRSHEWDKLMEGSVRANHREINRLVKKFLPDLYEDLALKFNNPYHYYRTKKHLILVHSSINTF